MTKGATAMPRVKESVSRAREVIVLDYVRSHLDGPEGAVISLMGIAHGTGLTVHQARAALRRLSRNGALSVVPRSYPNGASAENSYRLTESGFALLETAQQIHGFAALVTDDGGEV